MYDLRDYWRQGDDINTAFGRLHRAICDDIMAQEARQREKAEIIAELKAYIDNSFAIKFENAASPALEQLKKQIDSLFN